jgi:pimeloyl-ACP methyl ester carboxylesterase
VWDPVLPYLPDVDVLVPTLPGHAGGPPVTDDIVGQLEDLLDEPAHIAGNSLGGWLALALAARGCARSVVAIAPAGGADHGGVLERQCALIESGVVGHPGARALLARARTDGWPLDPALVTCPLLFAWGTEDPLLPWPESAERYRSWFPHADWVEIAGAGHHPQIDRPLETAQLIVGSI